MSDEEDWEPPGGSLAGAPLIVREAARVAADFIDAREAEAQEAVATWFQVFGKRPTFFLGWRRKKEEA